MKTIIIASLALASVPLGQFLHAPTEIGGPTDPPLSSPSLALTTASTVRTPSAASITFASLATRAEESTDTVAISRADYHRQTDVLHVRASSTWSEVTMDAYAVSPSYDGGRWWYLGTLTKDGRDRHYGSFTPLVSPASYNGPRYVVVISSGGGRAEKTIRIR